jgi:hypothetical protein
MSQRDRAHHTAPNSRSTAVQERGASRTLQRARGVTLGGAYKRRTLRRTLEHSADYAGRSPDSRTAGARRMEPR